MVSLIIDSREFKLRELLTEQNIPYEIKMMELGDIELTDGERHLIIERKSYQDLKSSIRDSRFREQRSRLLLWRNEENQKCIYFIEGQYTDDFSMEKRTLERLMIGYQIPVFFMKSMEDLVIKIKEWIELENLEKLFYHRPIELDQVESRMNQKRKKNYQDELLFFMEILSHIKGISSANALLIGKEFHSLREFILFYENNKEEWEKRMKTIENEKKKKLSKVLIEKIKLYFGLKID